MSENLTISTERVDDIPLLLAQLAKMGVAALLDDHFPTHGHWQGLSLGYVSDVWLTFILSESNHRMSHVEPWACERLGILERCLCVPVRALDFSDDRLASILDQFSCDETWDEFECDLNQRMLRVYDLSSETVRIDSTSAKSYTQSVEGLLTFGHSKDHRPDLPQVKINVSALDPLGLPLTTSVVSGAVADDGLYVPEIIKVQKHLSRSGVTYIGDCKMGALSTRAYIDSSGDYYLCPLSSVQVKDNALSCLLQPVFEGTQALSVIYDDERTDEKEALPIAEGYEYSVEQEVEQGETVYTFSERRLVIRSFAQANKKEKALRARLDKAIGAIEALNDRRQGKKRFKTEEELLPVVCAILSRYRVADLLDVTYSTTRNEQPVRRYRDRPAGVRIEQNCQVQVSVNETALGHAIAKLGWRVYATNQPQDQLSMQQAILAYRAEYRIEHGFSRLKGKPLSLTPMYLSTDERIKGLIRLLMVAMRTLTLLEFKVRNTLAQTGQVLRGLYPGQSGRKNERPTAELILRAFSNITLTRIRDGTRSILHITPLTPLQQHLLQLAGFQPSIYETGNHHF